MLIGSLGFRLMCLRGRSRAAGGREAALALVAIGSIGAMEIGIVGFCLRCEDVLQLPFASYVYGDLTPIAEGTRFGRRSW